MNATILYSARVNGEALKKWASKLPGEMGGMIIAEAVSDLLQEDADSLKSLPFVSRCNLRRKCRARVAITRPVPATEGKPLRIPVRRDTAARPATLARSRGRSVPAIAAEILLAAPVGER